MLEDGGGDLGGLVMDVEKRVWGVCLELRIPGSGASWLGKRGLVGMGIA